MVLARLTPLPDIDTMIELITELIDWYFGGKRHSFGYRSPEAVGLECDVTKRVTLRVQSHPRAMDITVNTVHGAGDTCLVFSRDGR
jgi:hypothetical protein